MKITNNSDISLSLAVWLVADNYDYVNEPNYISVTTLMKPLRQIILPRRVPESAQQADVEDFIARALGTALHDSIEKAWVHNYKRSLHLLGYPADVISRILINPSAEALAAAPDPIPIYLEQRAMKQIQGWMVGGKFDMVADGMVQDNKTTSAYTWVYGGRDDEHALQGSLYRWLNPEKILLDYIRINYIFTDWQKAQTLQNPKYPKKRVEFKDIPLLDITDTEKWITDKLTLVEKFMNVPEKELPECSDEELWMSEPKFKFYVDPAKMARSTKNCDTLVEAREYQASKGGKGIIVTIPGEPKRCDYCDGFDVCTQKDKFPKYQSS